MRTEYLAEMDGRAFSATSPEELLGLIAMWEMRGDNWRHKDDKADLYMKLDAEAQIYDLDGNVVE